MSSLQRRVFTAPLALLDCTQGEVLGRSEWHEVTQERVNLFADATDDHQWIHVDAERANSGPFGGTVAHGYLSLSLLPVLRAEAFDVLGISMGVNYGMNKVRFPAPVLVGSRIRAVFELLEVTSNSNGIMLTNRATIEIENQSKPACVAETISLYAS